MRISNKRKSIAAAACGAGLLLAGGLLWTWSQERFPYDSELLGAIDCETALLEAHHGSGGRPAHDWSELTHEEKVAAVGTAQRTLQAATRSDINKTYLRMAAQVVAAVAWLAASIFGLILLRGQPAAHPAGNAEKACPWDSEHPVPSPPAKVCPDSTTFLSGLPAA